MEIASRARALLARLTATSFGRPVPRDELEQALEREGASAAEAQEATAKLLEERSARETEGGLLPNSPPRVSRANEEMSMLSRLHR